MNKQELPAVAGRVERPVGPLRAIVAWFQERNRRTVPDEYLDRGYRRLATTKAEAERHAGHCYSCRHAKANVTWWCERDLAGLPCEWAACYSLDQITRADLKAGTRVVGGWLGLPREEAPPERPN